MLRQTLESDLKTMKNVMNVVATPKRPLTPLSFSNMPEGAPKGFEMGGRGAWVMHAWVLSHSKSR